jgi:hypothetical protein
LKLLLLPGGGRPGGWLGLEPVLESFLHKVGFQATGLKKTYGAEIN